MSSYDPRHTGGRGPSDDRLRGGRKALWPVLLACLAWAVGRILLGAAPGPSVPPDAASPSPARPSAARAVEAGQLHGSGTVYRLLPDDTRGVPHQKFLVRTEQGGSLLIVHNTRLAPRLEGLRVGDSVEFLGDYEANDKGGLVHWTHDDPAGRHPRGWILYKGRYHD